METIEEKLDRLADFYSQKDSLELRKRELMNEIQVPAEVEQIVNDGMARMAEVEDKVRAEIKPFDTESRMAEIVVPQEYKDALAELDRQRNEIMAKMQEVEKQKRAVKDEEAQYNSRIFTQIDQRKQEIQAEVEQKTHDVFAQIEQRKQEIAIEFYSKANDADINISKLEAEIKEDMKKHAAEKLTANPKSKDLSVKGRFKMAYYTKGRKTWIPAKLDDYTETHPDIKACYTEGEPSIVIRNI